MPKIMFVYIMANKDINPTLYTGVTNNLPRRVLEYKQELIEGFTKKYHLHNLVYFEVMEGQLESIIREKQIKNMGRVDKIKLIREHNPRFEDLYYRLSKELV